MINLFFLNLHILRTPKPSNYVALNKELTKRMKTILVNHAVLELRSAKDAQEGWRERASCAGFGAEIVSSYVYTSR